tara:strand:+ start:812 stop:1450 length:639 start_codon:yes stop_codon:yes gene_type:complete
MNNNIPPAPPRPNFLNFWMNAIRNGRIYEHLEEIDVYEAERREKERRQRELEFWAVTPAFPKEIPWFYKFKQNSNLKTRWGFYNDLGEPPQDSELLLRILREDLDHLSFSNIETKKDMLVLTVQLEKTPKHMNLSDTFREYMRGQDLYEDMNWAVWRYQDVTRERLTHYHLKDLRRSLSRRKKGKSKKKSKTKKKSKKKSRSYKRKKSKKKS